MLSCLLHKMYVCEEWVASSAGIPPPMKSKQDEELLKCWKLECIIVAELVRVAPVLVKLTTEEISDADTASAIRPSC